MNTAFLGAVNPEEENSWKKVLLSGLEAEFKLDTGAEVNLRKFTSSSWKVVIYLVQHTTYLFM